MANSDGAQQHGRTMHMTAAECGCYECVGSITAYTDDGHRYVKNNLKRHTQFEPCETCGRPKSEYCDHGTKGYYECWWCLRRAAGPFGPEAAPPTGGLS